MYVYGKVNKYFHETSHGTTHQLYLVIPSETTHLLIYIPRNHKPKKEVTVTNKSKINQKIIMTSHLLYFVDFRFLTSQSVKLPYCPCCLEYEAHWRSKGRALGLQQIPSFEVKLLSLTSGPHLADIKL